MADRLWECPKCHEHFYQYVIDGGWPVCGLKAKDCPAQIEAQNNRTAAALAQQDGKQGGA